MHVTDNLPYEFDRKLIAGWENQYNNGRDKTRYHEVKLYQTDSSYVLSIAFFSLYGEHEYVIAQSFTTVENAAEYLQSFDPFAETSLYLANCRPEEREREIKNIKFDWQELLCEIYRDLDISKKLDLPTIPNLQNIDNPDMMIIREICQEIKDRAKLEGISTAQFIKKWIESSK